MAVTNNIPPGRRSLSSPSVPAWKRIGLKLKYARDVTTDDSRGHAPSREVDSRSVFPHDDGDVTTKKASSPKIPVSQIHSIKHVDSSSNSRDISEVTKNDAKEAGNTNIGSTIEASSKKRKSEADLESPDEQAWKKRRKSVTFSSDTKTEDGFSRPAFLRSPVNSMQKRGKETQEVREDSSPLINKQPNTSSTNEAQKDKEVNSSDLKSDEKTRISSTTTTPASHHSTSISTPDYVSYLEQFYTDKSRWKFNKNKQTALIKDAFNLKRIPARHTPALVAYIGGLQGVGPLQKLLNDAESVLKSMLARQNRLSDIDGMEDPKMREAAYEAAVQRQIALNREHGYSEHDHIRMEEILEEMETDQRADEVLKTLLLKELYPERYAAPKPIGGGERGSKTAPSGPSKGTAKHTLFDDDDDDDDEDDEDHDDDDDDDENDDSRAVQKLAKKRKIEKVAAMPKRSRKSRTNIEASSSSSSSSEENSDDDDDDEASNHEENNENEDESSSSSSSSSSASKTSSPDITAARTLPHARVLASRPAVPPPRRPSTTAPRRPIPVAPTCAYTRSSYGPTTVSEALMGSPAEKALWAQMRRNRGRR